MDQFEMKNSGGIPSPYDARDFKLEEVASSTLPETLPDTCMLDISKLPIWMQGKIGSCVGHAWGKSQQYCQYIETGALQPLSARFLYAVSKCLDGYSGEGTYPRLTAKIMKDYGCATENTIPNDTNLDHETYVYQRNLSNIPKEAFEEAKKVTIVGYAFSPITEEGIKQAIYYAKTKRQGVVMLKRVGDTYWKDKNGNSTWEASKLLPLRAPTSVTSGHEVFPYGYEYREGRLVIFMMNSWSDKWADGGKAWFYFDEWQDFITEVMTSLDANDVPAFQFTRDLQLGMTHKDVKKLQETLNKLGFKIAESGAGSPGSETEFFGRLTLNAVKKFQTAHNLPTTGYFGRMTRGVINKML